MEQRLKPIYLLSDSQLLFWRTPNALFLDSIGQEIANAQGTAAYIGASNGDSPEFFAIFEAAMDGIGILERKQIHSSFFRDDSAFLEEAAIIVLAGGDVEAGWNTLLQTQIADVVRRRYYDGATLIGVSAGAVQLGRYAVIELSSVSHRLVDTFGLVPFVIDAHDEAREWECLTAAVRMMDGAAIGLGIPRGGGLIYHPDQTLEAVRRPVYEVSMGDSGLSRNLLVPKGETPERR